MSGIAKLSTPKEVAFFDTNSIDKSGLTAGVFGKRPALERVSREYEIMIPRIVFDELREHKRRSFKKQKESLLNNELGRLLEVDFHTVDDSVFEDIEESILEGEGIEYTVCEMGSPISFFDKYYYRAIRREPPFDAGSDKGFKDACVASTVERYLDEHPSVDRVFLVTADSRLGESFKDNPRVVVLGSVEELPCDSREREEYASKGNPTYREGPASKEGCATLAVPERDVSLKVALPPELSASVDEAVSRFCLSCSFQATHGAVEGLLPLVQHLGKEEKVRMVNAAATNDQISYLLRDTDVRELMLPLFKEVEECLTDDVYRTFVNKAWLANNRVDEYGNPQFSASEQRAFKQFVDDLIGHVSERGWDSAVCPDVETVLIQMRELLSRSSLDPEALSWRAIASVIFKGSLAVEKGAARYDEAVDFVDMVAACNQLKRDAVMRAVAAKLDEVEMDDSIPF